MLNLPHSLVPKLGSNFGSHKYILVGNKVDQLPVDGKGYADRWRKALTQACEEICGIRACDISHVALVSALTGFGLTEFIDFLLSRRFNSILIFFPTRPQHSGASVTQFTSHPRLMMHNMLLGSGSKYLFSSSGLSQVRWIPACLLKAYTKEQRHIKKLSQRHAPSDSSSVNGGLTFTSDNLNSFKLSELDDGRLEAIENRNIPNYSLVSRHDNPIKPVRSSTTNLLESYKDANISLRPLSVKCSGCGSPIHCYEAGAPGFVSRSTYESLIKAVDEHKVTRRGFARSLTPVVCVRCVVLHKHLHELSTSFDAATYKDLVISHIQKEDNATVIIVADMLNLPHSLVPKLGSNFGSHKYILVGNKVDQLPVDGKGYADRWRKALTQACEEICGIRACDISHVALVSALTGFGLTEFIDFLLSRRFNSICKFLLRFSRFLF
ncbi:hypothetical protein AHF37_06465 [Paragonimus kellicotti]|nr:hypothetical protein AHF37_06465 [Paragonimus kellicotti]